MSDTAGVLMIAGSALFFVGAGVAVPGIWTEPDRDARMRMIEGRLAWWRFGQPGFGLGAVCAALGVGALAAHDQGTTETWLAGSCAALLIGAVVWSWSLYQRAVRWREFALGQLPGWPFATYLWVTFVGLALLGVGLLAGDRPGWLGWVVLGADALFVAAYVRYRDIPPFVFYVLLCLVGVVVL